jgi:hypothetical protein
MDTADTQLTRDEESVAMDDRFFPILPYGFASLHQQILLNASFRFRPDFDLTGWFTDCNFHPHVEPKCAIHLPSLDGARQLGTLNLERVSIPCFSVFAVCFHSFPGSGSEERHR